MSAVDGHHPLDLLAGDVELLGNLVGRGVAAEGMAQLAGGTAHLVELADPVEREPDDARLLGQGLEYGLPDPPDRVGYEPAALRLVEALGRPDEAHVALVDQVLEGHALVGILLRDAHHEPEVGLGELIESVLVTCTNTAREIGFLLGCECLLAADLPQVQLERATFRPACCQVAGPPFGKGPAWAGLYNPHRGSLFPPAWRDGRQGSSGWIQPGIIRQLDGRVKPGRLDPQKPNQTTRRTTSAFIVNRAGQSVKG